jgi:isopenicillin N synthase-like dioxygenase
MEVKVANLRSAKFEKDLIESITNTGFVVVTDHGIPDFLIRDAQASWRSFFLQQQKIKNDFINGNNPNMGYKGMRTEKAVGAKVADLKEYFHWKHGQEIPEDQFKSTSLLFDLLEGIADKILKIIDEQNNTRYAEDCFKSDNTIVRALYYPEMDFSAESEAVRAAAHEDINCITLLVAASAPGLQVMDKNGKWFDVPHEDNSIVVNIGDMLQLASEGRYKSTTHRVVNMPGDRVSIPLFVHPHSDTILAPGKTAAQYLAERIAQIHGSKK